MPEPLHVSQSAWALLDMLQQQLGVSVEVLDASMRPVAPVAAGDAASLVEQPAIAAEIARSLRTGDIRIDRTTGVPIGIFPFRLARQIAGALIVTPGTFRPGEAPAPDVSIERVGYLARTALESDLTLSAQPSEARYRTRRAHGILRFVAQFGGRDSERELMNAAIQAATVWFDADCRIYERQADGSFLLAAALPGAEARPSAARIDQARAEKLLASRRFASGGDLEDLGLGGRRDEVLVLPVGAPSPEWLLLLSGAIDQEVELTFSAIARVLAGELQSREVARTDAWQERLGRLLADEKRRAPERVLLELLEALAADVGAAAARLTLVTGETERALAALGPPSPPSDTADIEIDTAEPAVPAFTGGLEIAPGTSLRLTLIAPGAPRAAAVQGGSWLKALHPWLREAVARIAARASLFEQAVEVSSFERRIQEEIERAKRFNLGLGLVLIAATPGDPGMEPVVAAIRSELRASDLMGRLRDGQVAVLLVHAEPIGADSVVVRLRQRLELLAEDTSLTALQLGKATFSADTSSADALIARARQQAERVELRN